MNTIDNSLIEIGHYLRADSNENKNTFSACSYRFQYDKNNRQFEIVNFTVSFWSVLLRIMLLQIIALCLIIYMVQSLPNIVVIIPFILLFIIVSRMLYLFYNGVANYGKYRDQIESKFRFRYNIATGIMEFPRDSVIYQKTSYINLYILNSEEIITSNMNPPTLLYKLSLLIQHQNGNWKRHLLTLNTSRSEKDIKTLKYVLGCDSITMINGVVKRDK